MLICCSVDPAVEVLRTSHCLDFGCNVTGMLGLFEEHVIGLSNGDSSWSMRCSDRSLSIVPEVFERGVRVKVFRNTYCYE